MNYKTLTHYLALGAAAVYGFILSPAGQAVVQQYPHLATLFSFLTTVGALYFKSAKAAQ